MTYAELASIDVGVEWRRDVLGGECGPSADVAPGSSRLLGFDEFLSIAAAADRPIGLRIEVKRPSTRGDLLERRIVEALAKHRMLPDGKPDWSIGAMSFSPTSLRNLHRLAPALPLVRLYARVPCDKELRALPRWIGGVGPGIRWVREDVTLPERIHSTGRVANVWTVDQSEDIDLMVKTGVDSIITNRPAYVRDRLTAY
jgi:glycerophosphoryl diester phosphodiesterase